MTPKRRDLVVSVLKQVIIREEGLGPGAAEIKAHRAFDGFTPKQRQQLWNRIVEKCPNIDFEKLFPEEK